MSDKDDGCKYVRKDVFDEKHKALVAEINARFLVAEKDIEFNRVALVSLNAKITGTLVFSIATLLTLIIMLATGRV